MLVSDVVSDVESADGADEVLGMEDEVGSTDGMADAVGAPESDGVALGASDGLPEGL